MDVYENNCIYTYRCNSLSDLGEKLQMSTEDIQYVTKFFTAIYVDADAVRKAVLWPDKKLPQHKVSYTVFATNEFSLYFRLKPPSLWRRALRLFLSLYNDTLHKIS